MVNLSGESSYGSFSFPESFAGESLSFEDKMLKLFVRLWLIFNGDTLDKLYDDECCGLSVRVSS